VLLGYQRGMSFREFLSAAGNTCWWISMVRGCVGRAYFQILRRNSIGNLGKRTNSVKEGVSTVLEEAVGSLTAGTGCGWTVVAIVVGRRLVREAVYW